MRPYAVLALAVLLSPLAAAAQPAAPAAASGAPASSIHWLVRDTTRVEFWRYFEPRPGGGDPDYQFIANRLFADVEFRGRAADVTAALQYVQFGGLPTNAAGPGALGTGPQYYEQSGRDSNSGHAYVRLANAKFKTLWPGGTVQVGRFAYASGAESPSGDAKIEAVKRSRLDTRLIGEFEWSLYQRTFDGVRVDQDRPAWHASGAWYIPTQGGFEDSAGASLRRVKVAAATFSVKPSASFKHSDWQGFVYRYDDDRAVTARPDNTLETVAAADVHITSVGTSLVGAYRVGAGGRVDALGWFVRQFGTWYGQDQSSGAVAAEVGYQRPATAWKPWLRAGWFSSTGDTDASDNRHETFFQMVPTARRYSLSTIYNLMNLTEVFGQAILRPRADIGVRLDFHHLLLTEPTDLWYAGSGATQAAGSTFGFAGRRSSGSTALGNIGEGQIDWTVTPHFTVTGYAGRMAGGAVVSGTFADRFLTFSYLETVIAF